MFLSQDRQGAVSVFC